jgi:hypothetical protein
MKYGHARNGRMTNYGRRPGTLEVTHKARQGLVLFKIELLRLWGWGRKAELSLCVGISRIRQVA